MMWDREATKQAAERLEDAKFEKQFEDMMQKKG
jgi:flavorubredoxin